MKKFITIISLALLAASCSSDSISEDIKTTQTSKLSPPEWIHGKWFQDNNHSTGYLFSKDDFCSYTLGIDRCYKEALSVYDNAGINTKVVQVSTNYEYKCEINISGSIVKYHFKKLNSETILDVSMSQVSGRESILIKQK